MEKIREKGSLHLILGFAERIRVDHVGAYAAQTAYFLMMSFIPFILFLTAIVQYTPLTYRVVRQVIIGIVPENLQGFGRGVFQEYRRAACIRHHGALVIRKRNAGADQRAEYHLSCKRDT